MKTLLIYLVILIVAVVSVWLVATFQQVTVQNKEDLRTISCGWPLAFALNNQEARDPDFPYIMRCLAREWGDLVHISPQPFFIDVIIFYAFFVFLLEAYLFTSKGILPPMRQNVVFIIVPIILFIVMYMMLFQKNANEIIPSEVNTATER